MCLAFPKGSDRERETETNRFVALQLYFSPMQEAGINYAKSEVEEEHIVNFPEPYEFH